MAQGITGRKVVAAALEHLADERGLPQRVFLDNGPEFISKALDMWAYDNGVTLDFSRPGKPTDSALIESGIFRLRGRLRDECPQR